MLLSTVSLDASPAQDLQPDPSAGPGGPAGTGPDSFAARLAQALDGLPQGQNLAAGPGLQTLQLGPGLEVITAGAGLPDADSLAAFATAQGLDPAVVAWLFGQDKPAGEGRGEGESAQATALDAALQAGLAGLVPVGPWIPASATPTAGALTGDSAPAEGRAASGGATLAGLGLAPTAAWLARPNAGLLGSGGTLGTEGAASAAADASSAATSLAASQALARSGQALQWLAQQTNATRAATASGANGTNGSMPVEVLALEVDPWVDALLTAENTPAPQDEDRLPASATPTPTGSGLAGASPGGSSGSTALTPGTAPAALPASGLQARADALHDLAQRLGEAVGQRVLGQVARGQWSMKLLLKPATLGEVEVDLRMRGGELDAAFRTLHPLTRDLLNDGLPRLREVLSGAGMDIAGLHVGHGSSQGSGGNPTPRQAMGESDRPAAADSAIIGPASAAGASAPRRSGSANWDVLV